MQQPFFTTRRALGIVLVCTLAGLLLKASEPVPYSPPPRVADEQPRRVTKRIVPHGTRARTSCDRGDRRQAPPLVAAHAVRLWREDQPPQAGVVYDEGWFAATPQAPIALSRMMLPAGRRGPAVDQVASSRPAAERPALQPSSWRRPRPKRRKPGKQRVDFTSDRVWRDTPPIGAPPRDTATIPSPAAPPDDIAFRSGENEQFPTEGQVAIPIQRPDLQPDQPEGGSISLWVQPGWERGNEDDATLVQLGERLRLAKNVDVLRLEAADADADLGIPITEWNPGEWHHVAATWSEDAISLYVDGELVGRHTGHGPLGLPPETALLVGSEDAEDRPVARGLIGRVDVRSRPLGDDEVARDYHAAVDGNERPDHGNEQADRGNGNAPADRGERPADRGPSDMGRSHGLGRGAVH